ncbi:hypothetical protein MKL29_03520 [Streptococcus suis]|nr:hypothetical protein [Streptococcus suis]
MTEVKHNPYKWHDDLIEGAEKNRNDKEKESRAGWQAYNDKVQKKLDEHQKIIDKASEIYLEEERRKREEVSAREQQEAINQIELEHEKKFGIKSKHSKEIDSAWSSLARDLIKE